VNKAAASAAQQWCSKTIKLQDQDHLIFQHQDRSGQHQDHFFKTQDQDRFLKDHQIINPRLFSILIGRGPNVTLFWWRFLVT